MNRELLAQKALAAIRRILAGEKSANVVPEEVLPSTFVHWTLFSDMDEGHLVVRLARLEIQAGSVTFNKVRPGGWGEAEILGYAQECAEDIETSTRSDLRYAILSMLAMDPDASAVLAECRALAEEAVAEAVHRD